MGTVRRTLAVCGPTASGKSAVSIQLANALQGEVVNVDSVQVYRGLDLGSAKLTVEERHGVVHHVLDIFAPNEAANVAKFRAEALAAIDDITARHRLPILVGGSGLYLTALLHGLADVPATPPEAREAVASLKPEEQYAELTRVDPVTAARLHPHDTQRISRAVEIARVTGRPASELFARHTFTAVEVASLVLVICRPRDELYSRIDQRAKEMVERGLIPETEGLLRQYGRVLALETLGYKQACDYLEGSLREDNLVHEIAMHTRRFAKRQMTYWRNEPKKRGWYVRPGDNEEVSIISGFEEHPARAQMRMKGFRAYAWSWPELVERVRVRLLEPLDSTEVWYVRTSA